MKNPKGYPSNLAEHPRIPLAFSTTSEGLSAHGDLATWIPSVLPQVPQAQGGLK